MTQSALNPYQSPKADLSTNTSDQNSLDLFKITNVRIGRLRYLCRGFIAGLASYAVLIPGFLLMLASPTLGYIVLAIGYIALIAITILFVIQRLHDLNKNGWMALLALIPIVNIIFFIYILFFKGTASENNYGHPPPPNKTWHKVVGGIIIFLIAASIIAAIAMPALFMGGAMSGLNDMQGLEGMGNIENMQ